MSAETKTDKITSKQFNDLPNALSTLPGTVILDSVSKSFKKQTAKRRAYDTVKTSFLQKLLKGVFVKQLFTKGATDNYLEALKSLSIHVRPGESLGVIGRNGSGKSTLLKLISGIYQADQGTVRSYGRISALIELGAGFHPDFTGRENVYLGGVMYGLTRRQIDALFDQIVAYAELEDFIDDPVKTYSSGMYMRLGFSLAVHTDPDILLVDEVLAVGDAAFIHRCHDTLSEFKRKGKTLIFVTHDLSSVERWCDEAIWLQRGIVRLRGEPRRVIDSYIEDIEKGEAANLVRENNNTGNLSGDKLANASSAQSSDVQRWGNLDVEITAVRMLDGDNSPTWMFSDEDQVTIEVDYQIQQPIEDLVFGIGILRVDGAVVHGSNTDIEDVQVPIPEMSQSTGACNKGGFTNKTPLQGTYCYRIKRLGLIENSYYLDVAAHSSEGLAYDYHHRMHKFSVRTSAKQQGVFNPEHQWEFRTNYQARAQDLLSAEKKLRKRAANTN